ncbi:hypothetical protein AGABI1DRAFT_111840 [Agaricus bisporus var. burnettii JB137-S8]|nr:uncharacterized protein AGABI1DRAFT_111840 [Agaricus bisporus var. burnettii JB137-S8]EKM81551.1 hypothetical protein AGABI1DRAFT_111840 [Agaricus bisporus var. burnettii JB137-S8]
MAQAVFDEHPLEQYLRQAGDDPEPMPGTTAELTQELELFSLPLLSDTDDPDTDTDTPSYPLEEECRPQFLICL